MSLSAHHVIRSCIQNINTPFESKKGKDEPPCKYRITRSFLTILFAANSHCIRFHNLLLITHSPVICRFPVSAASASARNPLNPLDLTRNEMGVTMPSFGVGRSEPKSSTELFQRTMGMSLSNGWTWKEERRTGDGRWKRGGSRRRLRGGRR